MSGKSRTSQGKQKARKENIDTTNVTALIQALAALIGALASLLLKSDKQWLRQSVLFK